MTKWIFKEFDMFENSTLNDFVQEFPHSDGKFINARCLMEINGITHPIGLCVLASGKIAISSPKRDSVKLYDSEGTFLKNVEGSRTLKRPSDLLAIPDGRFIVRDDLGMLLFDPDGNFYEEVMASTYGRFFGLTTDLRGNLYVVVERLESKKGESRAEKTKTVFILKINIHTKKVLLKIDLDDIVENVSASKCRFLHYRKHKLYISDLGAHKVYILDVKKLAAKVLGSKGTEPGQFIEPAGVGVDKNGTMLIADAGNSRLLIFDRKKKFIGKVMTDKKILRPSSIVLNLDNDNPELFVLSLKTNSLLKYVIEK